MPPGICPNPISCYIKLRVIYKIKMFFKICFRGGQQGLVSKTNESDNVMSNNVLLGCMLICYIVMKVLAV